MDEVDQVAIIRMVNQNRAYRWNRHRRQGQPRLLTGWVWTAKRFKVGRQNEERCLKCKTAAYIAAWYVLVAEETVPTIEHLKVVYTRKAA